MLTAVDARRYKLSCRALEATQAHAQAGRWRECVDKYKLAFRKSGDATSTFTSRYHCVSGFTSSLTDKSVLPDADDWALLSEVINNETELPVVRAKCAMTKGILLYDTHDRDGAAQCYRRLITLAKKAKKGERGEKIWATHPKKGTLCQIPSGALLDQLESNATGNLKSLESRVSPFGEGVSISNSFSTPATPLNEDGIVSAVDMGLMSLEEQTKVIVTGRLEQGPRGYFAHASLGLTQKELDARLNIVGQACHRCGRRAKGKSFRKCSGCLLVSYCSLECQRTHWSSGHKGECRATLSPGDFVVVLNRTPSDVSAVNATQIGALKHKVKGEHGLWVVSMTSTLTIQAPASDLRRLPPTTPPPEPEDV
mmetsp:Transcript_25990/g.65077  ORF Transcript_25990/g.65077 Transcript_25990/m.65077 type:complete len:368 (-) Transcript_25990:271-1374(-)|eukprot:CAMPEP_0181361304 /NCGR_PEP_ID=MMETSP1106-20121128/7200_1 /TAXON_ID=81844 /ORGANISM="Mantoniella antarctica, Strain SL-175" /LENGTH=367 /DNA_ID=CAMNT_0023474779 /DNA_START=222 /DNA_END=1325 /DNA_ORIENTATION=-